jgi:hypothetical protein
MGYPSTPPFRLRIRLFGRALLSHPTLLPPAGPRARRWFGGALGRRARSAQFAGSGNYEAFNFPGASSLAFP